MSQPSSPGTITKAAFDTNIGPLIIQAFLSGLYTFILYRTVHGAGASQEFESGDTSSWLL
ncbi:hypothetical protein BDQ17DRAFT_1434718 [Cyathus striatus]|nr:hypothetical protein BDQ17DRAFT_1434718 [Cyathus striatus]